MVVTDTPWPLSQLRLKPFHDEHDEQSDEVQPTQPEPPLPVEAGLN